MLFTINVIVCEKSRWRSIGYFRKGCCKPQSTVCSSVPPSICLSVWLSVTCSVGLPWSVFPRICQLVCVSDHFSPQLPTYPSVWPSACVSVCLSVSLYLYANRKLTDWKIPVTFEIWSCRNVEFSLKKGTKCTWSKAWSCSF